MSARDTSSNPGSNPKQPGVAQQAAGAVEACRDGKLVGWAQVPGMPLVPAIVDIMIDNQRAGSVKANLMRADLRQRSIRDGFAGFEYLIPDAFRDGGTHRFTAVERVSQTALAGLSTFRFEGRTETSHRSQLFAGATVLAHSVNAPHFRDSLARTGRLALMCAYAPDGRVHDFHRSLASGVSEAGFTVLFIQGLDDVGGEIAKTSALPDVGDGAVLKDNRGYDFGSWLAGLALVDELLPSVRELLLVNDSAFGPLQGGVSLARLLQHQPGDVLGMTDSYQHRYHLQSYFLLLREAALRSGALKAFAASYAYGDDKSDVVMQGELALTQALMDRGHSCLAMFPYEVMARKWLDRLPLYQRGIMSLPEYGWAGNSGGPARALERLAEIAAHVRAGEPLNPSQAFWEVLLDSGMPFIKRELLFRNPMNVPLLEQAANLIQAQGYPVAQIRDAAKRYGTSRVFF
jgi:hypothetical protein